MIPTSFPHPTFVSRFKTAPALLFSLATAFSLAMFAGGQPAQAQLDDESPMGGPQTEATLIGESQNICPGQPFTVAVSLKLEKGWHVYWRNPGDSGTPTQIIWSLPAGFRAGAIQWPVPQRFAADGLVAYGYENEVTLLTQITPPATLTPGQSVSIGANVDWLICSEQCVPQKKYLGLAFKVSSETPALDKSNTVQFAAARSSLPAAVSSSGFWVRAQGTTATRVKPATAGINLLVSPLPKTSLPADQLKQLYFYPADESTLTHPATQKVVKEGNLYRLPLTPSEYATAPLARLRGVLLAPQGKTKGSDSLSRGIWIDVPVMPPSPPFRAPKRSTK